MIPKHAKQVFKGVAFDVFHWKQKMYDGSTRTFEGLKRTGGVSIIAAVGKKVVVLHQKQPTKKWYYSLPGGLIDPGESPKQAAIRELQEETGLKATNMKLWKSFEGTFRIESKYNVYIAQNCQPFGEQRLDGGEIIEIEYRTFEEFLMLSEDPLFRGHEVTHELLRARLSKTYQAQLKKLIFG